jgi:ribonuclease HI
VAYIDGASSGNPGPAAYAYIIRMGRRVVKGAGRIGVATNNVAEYYALIRCLKRALDLGCGRIRVNSDSELLVRQMIGEYAVKSHSLLPLYQEAMSLAALFKSFEIVHVPREMNREADTLANVRLSGESKRRGR